MAGATSMGAASVEQFLEGERRPVGAPAFDEGGIAQPVALTLGGAQRAAVCGALAALGLEALPRGGQLLLGDPAAVAGAVEFVVVVVVAETLLQPLEDEATVQVRRAEADDERQHEHRRGEDAGDPGELEQDFPDTDVDGSGAGIDEHKLLHAVVEAGAEHDGGRDQHDEQDEADHGRRRALLPRRGPAGSGRGPAGKWMPFSASARSMRRSSPLKSSRGGTPSRAASIRAARTR